LLLLLLLWVPTNPEMALHVLAYNMKRVMLKMLKGWNKSRELFKSFHLETIALAALNGVKIEASSRCGAICGAKREPF
jgi:hypothetical protein